MKRLYVDPELRSQGTGHALALAGIRAARELGYRRMLVDTLPAMRIALRLQVANVCHTSVVQDAWNCGQELIVHGWIYSLRDGLLHDLNFTVTCQADVQQRYRSSLAALGCSSGAIA